MKKLAQHLEVGDTLVVRYGSLVLENTVDQITIFWTVDEFEDYFGPLEGFFYGDPDVGFPFYYVLSYDIELADFDEFYFNFNEEIEVVENVEA